jgi:hypothetical protein
VAGPRLQPRLSHVGTEPRATRRQAQPRSQCSCQAGLDERRDGAVPRSPQRARPTPRQNTRRPRRPAPAAARRTRRADPRATAGKRRLRSRLDERPVGAPPLSPTRASNARDQTRGSAPAAARSRALFRPRSATPAVNSCAVRGSARAAARSTATRRQSQPRSQRSCRRGLTNAGEAAPDALPNARVQLRDIKRCRAALVRARASRA